MRNPLMVRVLLVTWLASLLGCAAVPHVVRFRSASGATWTYRPSSRAEPIQISQRQFQESVRSTARALPDWERPVEDARLFFEIPERSGVYLYEVRTHRLIPERADSPMDEVSNEQWVADYKAWCGSTGLGHGDCLGILLDGHLTSHGRYVLALWISRGEVLEEAIQSARETGRPKAVLAMLASGVGMYFMLWALPEPISKGVAAGITIALIGYLGFDTVLQMGTAFDQLVRESDQAKDFAELRAAGQRFGKVFGQNAARALISLAAAAIGRTGGDLASKLPSLPGAPQMSRVVLEAIGFDMAMMTEVEAVVVSPGTVSISLASGSAVTMAVASRPGGGENTLRITFSEQGTAGHGARHLEGTGLTREGVEEAITAEIRSVAARADIRGSFWGRVSLQGRVIEFRAYPLPDGRINVGTYYPIR
jgi:hypothetical protein